jgi:hypothetical protein
MSEAFDCQDVIFAPYEYHDEIATRECNPQCRWFTCEEQYEPNTWTYNAEHREDISGSVTQPSSCHDVSEVVAFASAVCSVIGASGAISVQGGVVIISSSQFSGFEYIEYTCPSQCNKRLDVFKQRRLEVAGKRYKKSVKLWEHGPTCYPNIFCGDNEEWTTTVDCPGLACEVTVITKTFREPVFYPRCCQDAPGAQIPCCGRCAQ